MVLHETRSSYLLGKVKQSCGPWTYCFCYNIWNWKVEPLPQFCGKYNEILHIWPTWSLNASFSSKCLMQSMGLTCTVFVSVSPIIDQNRWWIKIVVSIENWLCFLDNRFIKSLHVLRKSHISSNKIS